MQWHHTQRKTAMSHTLAATRPRQPKAAAHPRTRGLSPFGAAQAQAQALAQAHALALALAQAQAEQFRAGEPVRRCRCRCRPWQRQVVHQPSGASKQPGPRRAWCRRRFLRGRDQQRLRYRNGRVPHARVTRPSGVGGRRVPLPKPHPPFLVSAAVLCAGDPRHRGPWW